MKPLWLAAATGLIVVAPACAQENPVKAGVDAWQRGDYATAVKDWRGPANAGDADAQFNMGQAYKLGRGVPADLSQAEIWYGKAALQGHEQAEASYGLALFANSKDDPAKRDRAVPWLQRASSRGDPRAQYILGTMYFNGDSVEKDWVRGYALVTRSSQTGLSEASQALAEMDKYMTLADRQAALQLARKYEEEANRAPLPPVAMANTTPARSTPPGTRPPPRPSAAPPIAAPVRASGPWRVQLGAFGEPGNARKLWSQVAGRFPGRQVYYVPAGRLTKVLVGPYATRGEAAAACGNISPCVPVTR